VPRRNPTVPLLFLLDAGASRVYAVDAGAGQLRGWLRADPRVVNLERTNLACLGPHLIVEPAGLVTMDLSYLSIVEAIGQVDRRLLAPSAQLIASSTPHPPRADARLGGSAGDVQAGRVVFPAGDQVGARFTK
jgi:23S rRNA (cytidine1920-2'-O)/16S rRNA (cytidine1409-2'-O)-methyltransferase